MQQLKIISAGAGSGKTYRLTKEMTKMLQPSATGKAAVRASGIIATTFTNKAAAELKERVRIELLESGLTKEADELANAMIGTVHAIGVQLLKRFAFEAGVSPEVSIIADSDQQVFFNQAIATVLKVDLIKEMSDLTEWLGFDSSPYSRTDWRKDLKNITDIARANNFGVEVLQESKAYSIQSFFELLPPVSDKDAAYFNHRLLELMQATLEQLIRNEDATKAKETMLSKLKGFVLKVKNQGMLSWRDWVSICKLKPSKKTRDDIADLVEFAQTHTRHPDFHQQIKTYLEHIFDAAIAAINEYDQYKKSRGLIDYIDMEVLILDLLENKSVLAVLKDEIDLLMVDEFQDTSPLQLKIFLKLTNLANQSVWVGDPKQSIYGFRGADPELMQAVMQACDNIANLPDSWRSREDLVHLCNGLFVKALSADMPVERIALNTAAPYVKAKESKLLQQAVHHWHFQHEKRQPGKPWFERCIARSIADLLEQNWQVRIKGSDQVRPLEAGDIAVLCRSNYACQTVAETLYDEGLKAAIARAGLVETAEAKLTLACLRYIVNPYDALAVAEILLLAKEHNLEALIEDRLAFLAANTSTTAKSIKWGTEEAFVRLLNKIREESEELSAIELLNLLIDTLDLRRIVSKWSNAAQRLDNIDALRKLAGDYEDTCNRLNSAATSGGFLLWLEDLAQEGKDVQGKGLGKDAVNVLTYHKSKGLEWPLVICHGIDADLKDAIWGVRIVRKSAKIDIHKPLADRLICYWVNPYAMQIKGTALMEEVEAHQDRVRVKKNALDEEIRLLYVGLTRARDYLIFPSVPKKNTKWLNRVFHDGIDNIPVLDVTKKELPWLWKDKEIALQNHVFNYGQQFVSTPLIEGAKVYLEPFLGARDFEAAEIPFAVQLFPSMEFKFTRQDSFTTVQFSAALEEGQLAALKLVLKVMLLADKPGLLSDERRLEMARDLCFNNGLHPMVDAKKLLQYSSHFFEYLQRQFVFDKLERYKMFQYHLSENVVYNSSIDICFVSQQNELVLMQFWLNELAVLNKHKPKFKELACQLEAAGKSIGKSLGITKIQHYVLDPYRGLAHKIEVQRGAVQSSLFG